MLQYVLPPRDYTMLRTDNDRQPLHPKLTAEDWKALTAQLFTGLTDTAEATERGRAVREDIASLVRDRVGG